MPCAVDSRFDSADDVQDVPRTPSSRPTRLPVSPSVAPAVSTPLTAESVPKPTSKRASEAPIDVREGFLFLHADGDSSLFAIAEMTGLPLDDVKRGFEALRAKGVIALDGGETFDPLESERPTVTPPPIPRVVGWQGDPP
jgi:hypothetical protein